MSDEARVGVSADGLIFDEDEETQCRTPTGHGGLCTAIDDCVFLAAMSISNRDRFFNYVVRAPCPNQFLVCCPVDAALETPPVTSRPSTSRTMFPTDCGRSPALSGRIQGGAEAEEGFSSSPFFSPLSSLSSFNGAY